MIDISQIKRDFYVYEWFNIDTDEIFYVGKGTKGRWKNTKERNEYFINYHNKYECDVRKIKDNLSEKEAFDLEVDTIKFYRDINQCRCNLSDGGEGSTFEDGSWDDMYRRVRNLYHLPAAKIDEIPFADSYYYEDLKGLTVEELRIKYDSYEIFRDANKTIDGNYEHEKIMNSNLTIFHKMTQDELLEKIKLINDETKFCVDLILKNNDYYEDVRGIEDISEFIIDRNEMVNLVDELFQSPEYLTAFAEALWASLWFVKNMGAPYDYFETPVNMQIKTFSIVGDMRVRVRLKYHDSAKVTTKTLDIYDIMWDLICFPDQLLCSTLLINLYDGFYI